MKTGVREHTTGTGQKLVGVHKEVEECERLGCVLHNPTDPNAAVWPTRWDKGVMYRDCPHGKSHPDLNHLQFVGRTRGLGEALQQLVHDCDGCCQFSEFTTRVADHVREHGHKTTIQVKTLDIANFKFTPGNGWDVPDSAEF